jgi:hypothetical protein
MRKSALEVYALAICFVTLAAMCFTGAVAVFSAVQITQPSLTLYPGQLQPYQSNEAFKAEAGGAPSQNVDPQDAGAADADLTQQRMKAMQDVIATEKAMGERNLVIQGLLFLLNLILFGWHWRMAGRERERVD